ncbi:MAG: dienelactone hydrolase family protein [Candidatus Dormibacteraeota bacterium]|nr:dienelactone hydrolase family protein [Candidatus Dormibacteraeota bacterium]
MCYTDDARPPLPRISGAAADQGEIHLNSADGNPFLAYFARAGRPTGAGIVIMPDVRGLHDFYKELAQRFAETGVDAVAIDYFGRTAADDARDEGFDFRAHLKDLEPSGISADVLAAVEYLRSEEMGSPGAVFTVGFCFGGAQSWRQSAAGHGLAGCIGFYGRPEAAREVLGGMRAPLLLLVAGADFTPLDEFQRFDRELAAGAVPHRMVIYPGAPHSFFDRTFAEHREACDDAWEQMLGFIRDEGGSAGSTATDNR